MRKIKKVLALSLALAMGLSLVACGDKKDDSTTTEAPKSEDTQASEDAPASEEDSEAPSEDASVDNSAYSVSDGGKVLNIYVWNDEFANRMKDHMPGYEAANPDVALDGGKIGDVQVNFIQNDNQGGVYQLKLDEALLAQADADTDEKVDMFLIEADYALKYANDTVSVPVDVLGIQDSETADQFEYTKQVVTDADGRLKGLSWQACPGLLIYNREAAKEVLGSDDPAAVQEAVKDWATYNATAAKMKEAGYLMTATVNDSFRVYSNNTENPWVIDNKVAIDPKVKSWIDDSKALVDAGQTTTNGMWGDEWNSGFFPEGKVFCYFGPAWLINFSMKADEAGSIANAGGWGAVEGPEGYFWGGTWLCAANGTDNAAEIAEIMRQMTTNPEVMKGIATKDSDCVNNKAVLADLASSDEGNLPVLGGQNPFAMFSKNAEAIDLSNLTAYDQQCVELCQAQFKDYFDGNLSYEDAETAFYDAVIEAYPALSK